MAEPPQRKRKVDKITPAEEGKSVEETTPTFYILKEGRYVAVEKDSQESYVSPPDSDEDVDPVLEQEYYRQIRESGGFDCDVHIPNGSLLPFKWFDDDEDEIGICAKVGLHWYNFLKGSNYRLLRVDKYNSILTGLVTYYITADVIDPASNSRFVFQTCVTQSTCKSNEDFRIVTEFCGIKSETQGSEDEGCQWDDEAIDCFYKGDLKWLPDDALVQSSDKQQQYYEETEAAAEPEIVGRITRSRAKEMAKEAHTLMAEGLFNLPRTQVFNITILETSPGNDN